MVLKELYTSPYYDRIACVFSKNRGNGLERIPRSPPFAVCWPYQAKMAEYAGGLT